MTETAAHIVLVGAGHCHLHIAANARKLSAAGAVITMISPSDFWYSGMATGMLGGDYEAGDDRLDPKALVERAGGNFVKDRVTAIDRSHRRIHLSNGDTMAYDLLSLNVGSQVSIPALPGLDNAKGLWPAKPIKGLWELRERLESDLANASALPKLAIIGGGPTGVELAANLLGLSERYGRSLDIHLVSSEKRVLPDAPRSASAWITRRLLRRGLKLELSTNALAYRQGHIVLDDGTTFPADYIITATGLSAPDLIGELDLPYHPHHGLAITPALHSLYDERLFAVGDCAWLKSSPYPKLGVFGVRQGPILLANLLARLEGAPLIEFNPQQRYLSILNLGDGRGLALWGKLWWTGRLALLAKRHIDHRFMAQYRAI